MWTILLVEYNQLLEVYYRTTHTVASVNYTSGTLGIEEQIAHLPRIHEDLPKHQIKLLLTFLKF